MYHYIKGIVKEIKNNAVIIENNGIGYYIGVSNSDVLKVNKEIKLFTYFYVKDNIHSLYGFLDPEMLFFFQKLIAIPNIGVKSAILLANQFFFEKIKQAVQQNDIDNIIQFPGIGKKTAQQMIFHLNHVFNIKINHTNFNPKQKNIKEALIKLGFTNKQIINVLPRLCCKNNLEDMLKEALTFLIPLKEEQNEKS